MLRGFAVVSGVTKATVPLLHNLAARIRETQQFSISVTHADLRCEAKPARIPRTTIKSLISLRKLH